MIDLCNGKKGVVVIEGHVQGLANTRLLGRAKIPVIVIDKENCIAKSSKFCQKFLKCPDFQSEDFISYLLDLQQREQLQDWLLLPSNDHAVFNISNHKYELSGKYKIITDDIAVIEKIYNKRKLLGLAKSISIPIPETVMPFNEHPTTLDLRYPVLIKGNNGLTFGKKYKTKAFLLHNERELHGLLSGELRGANPEDYFVQEVLPKGEKTVSVSVFAIDGVIHTYWMGEKIREHPLQFGTATCCRSVLIDPLLDLTVHLIKHIRFTGVCEVEWLKDSRDGSFKLIEINARTWLWVGLAARGGINYPLMIYNYLTNGEIPTHKDYKTDKIWLNLYTDLYYSARLLMKGEGSISNIIHTYKSFTEACWDPFDTIPFFKYGLMLPSFLKTR